MVVVNGKEYAWGDIVVWIFGQPIYGIRGINYKKGKEKTHLHAAGRMPKSIQHGKRTADGDATFTQSELDALNRSARAKGYKDILDVDMDIVVTYGSSELVVTVDTVRSASFSEMPKGMNTDSAFMEITMPFLAMDVEENV